MADESQVRCLCVAIYRHEAAWFSPAPAPDERTLEELDRALEPFIGMLKSSNASGVPAEQQSLVADALTLVAHGAVLPERLAPGLMRRTRDPRRALDAVNKAVSLTRVLSPAPSPLVVLQRLRLRANALFRLRSYRPAREDLMESLRLLRKVADAVDAAVGEAAGADAALDQLRMIAVWTLTQWLTVCFNLSLCARYLNGPDEALLWIDAANAAATRRQEAAEALAADHPALQFHRTEVEPKRVHRGISLLRRIVSVDTSGQLLEELGHLQEASSGSSFAGGLALVQTFVERYLVVATMRAAGIAPPPKHRRTRSGGFLSAIASVFSTKRVDDAASSGQPVPTAELVRALPESASTAEDETPHLADACLKAANELATVLTEGNITDISPFLTGHLPSFLQGSGTMATRHSMVTLLDFALTNTHSASWRAAVNFARDRATLQALATCPALDVFSKPEPAPPGTELSTEAPPAPQPDSAASLAELLREYTLEEELVLFDFNPVAVQGFLLALHQPVIARPPMPSQPASPESLADGSQTSTPPPQESNLAAALQTMTDDFTPDAVGAVMTTLTAQQRQALHGHLPQHLQGRDWHCVFSSREHGSSFTGMFARTADLDETLLVIKPLNAPTGSAVGAFISAPLQRNKTCHQGGGESFVFTFDFETRVEIARTHGQAEPPAVSVFRWSQRNSYFYESKPGHFSIGGGSSGAALYIEEYLRAGATHACDTFDSPKLLASTHGVGDFRIAAVEVFAL